MFRFSLSLGGVIFSAVLTGYFNCFPNVVSVVMRLVKNKHKSAETLAAEAVNEN